MIGHTADRAKLHNCQHSKKAAKAKALLGYIPVCGFGSCSVDHWRALAAKCDCTILLDKCCPRLTWLALLEDDLAGLQGVVLHALGQAKQLAVAQAEEDGDLAQRLKAPHVLDGAQQAVEGLACQSIAHQLRFGCHSCSPASHVGSNTRNIVDGTGCIKFTASLFIQTAGRHSSQA